MLIFDKSCLLLAISCNGLNCAEHAKVCRLLAQVGRQIAQMAVVLLLL